VKALGATVAILAAANFCATGTLAQTVETTDLTATTNSAPAALEGERSAHWSSSVSAYTYVLPEGRSYVQPTVTADHDWLHLEARYNYEKLDTASVWLGYNFSGGEKFAWEFTPMFGDVFGNSSGFAPGFKGSLSWWKLELYTEGEYVIDPADSSENFFYSWSELTLAPVQWLRFGLVGQRTHAYQTDREIQPGLLLGFSYKKVDLTGYMFNPDESRPIWVVAITFNL
jgi:hypothetical protein